MVASDTFFATHSEQLAALTVRHAIPAIHQSRDFAIAGGLMSYAGDFVESHRQAGIQTGRILKGEKPADLPVQQVTKVGCSSISRQPRRSALRSRCRCSPAPTR